MIRYRDYFVFVLLLIAAIVLLPKSLKVTFGVLLIIEMPFHDTIARFLAARGIILPLTSAAGGDNPIDEGNVVQVGNSIGNSIADKANSLYQRLRQLATSFYRRLSNWMSKIAAFLLLIAAAGAWILALITYWDRFISSMSIAAGFMFSSVTGFFTSIRAKMRQFSSSKTPAPSHSSSSTATKSRTTSTTSPSTPSELSSSHSTNSRNNAISKSISSKLAKASSLSAAVESSASRASQSPVATASKSAENSKKSTTSTYQSAIDAVSKSRSKMTGPIKSAVIPSTALQSKKKGITRACTIHDMEGDIIVKDGKPTMSNIKNRGDNYNDACFQPSSSEGLVGSWLWKTAKSTGVDLSWKPTSERPDQTKSDHTTVSLPLQVTMTHVTYQDGKPNVTGGNIQAIQSKFAHHFTWLLGKFKEGESTKVKSSFTSSKSSKPKSTRSPTTSSKTTVISESSESSRPLLSKISSMIGQAIPDKSQAHGLINGEPSQYLSGTLESTKSSFISKPITSKPTGLSVWNNVSLGAGTASVSDLRYCSVCWIPPLIYTFIFVGVLLIFTPSIHNIVIQSKRAKRGPVGYGFASSFKFWTWIPTLLAISGFLTASTIIEYDDWVEQLRNNKPLLAFTLLALFKGIKAVVHAFSYYYLTQPTEIPISRNVTPDEVTFIVPSLKPFGDEFENRLESILDNKPHKVIITTCGITNKLEGDIIAKKFRGNVEVIMGVSQDPRTLFIDAIPNVDTHLTVYATDESTFSKNFLKSTLAEFEDVRVGTVTPPLRVNLDPTFLNSLFGLVFDRAAFEATASYNLDGGIPGYRSGAILVRTEMLHSLDFRSRLLSEFWAGSGSLETDCNHFITRHAMRIGYKTVFRNDPDSVVDWYISPGAFTDAKLLGQEIIRQTRAAYRHNLMVLFGDRSCWWTYPWSTYALFMSFFTELSLFYDAALIVTLHAATGTKYLCVCIFFLVILKAIPSCQYLKNHKSYIIYLPLYLLAGYFDCFIKIYSFLTLGKLDDWWENVPLGSPVPNGPQSFSIT